MIFSDPVFLFLFLPSSVLAHRLALRHSEAAAQWVLIGASLVFYGAWDARWLPLLVGTVAMNLWVGRWLIRYQRRRILIAGVLANLLPLALCKYAGWLSGGYVLSDVALPLGISFFTFQQIGFIVDAYLGKVDRIETRHYALFVSFFSQLIAGPICHHKEMIDQFRQRFSLTPAELTTALLLLGAGLVKKAVVADRLAPYAERLFDGDGIATLYEAWVGSLAYTFQLLFDFAGYGEMAMGLALLFGYRIPVNFLSPYKSCCVTEFWRRWHITLGRFFRDYVYIPLGGNRRGAGRMYLALFVTAFVSGLWHGAGTTFLIWGLMHGAALVLEKFGSRAGLRLPRPLGLVATFLFVSLAWVMFRSPNVEIAINVYASLAGLHGAVMPPLLGDIIEFQGPVHDVLTGFEAFVLAFLVWWVWTRPNVHEMDPTPTFKRFGIASAATVAIVLSITSPAQFLYFQF